MVIRRFLASASRRPRGADGWRGYVVGDVHGCFDLFDRLLADIAADHRRRPPARGLLVLLGDLIDRGPASAQVMARVRELGRSSDLKLVTLSGNHEEVLHAILEGNARQVSGWLKFGGIETLGSYGIDAAEIAKLPPAEAQRRIAAAIPAEDRALLESMGDSFRFGDYLFVHAGIRPGIPLEQQALADLRWIREPFLSDRRDHGMTVVHGHTISKAVEEIGSRIGIDTGAYATGRLTALGIEGRERWTLDTVEGLIVRERKDA